MESIVLCVRARTLVAMVLNLNQPVALLFCVSFISYCHDGIKKKKVEKREELRIPNDIVFLCSSRFHREFIKMIIIIFVIAY